MPKHVHHSSYLGFAWGEGKKTNHPSATITAQFPGFDHKCVDVQSCSALARVLAKKHETETRKINLGQSYKYFFFAGVHRKQRVSEAVTYGTHPSFQVR